MIDVSNRDSVSQEGRAPDREGGAPEPRLVPDEEDKRGQAGGDAARRDDSCG